MLQPGNARTWALACVSSSNAVPPFLYSSEFLHFLFESLGQAVIVTSVEGTIVRWNQAAERLYGWRSQEAVGRQILEVTPSEQARDEAEAILANSALGTPGVAFSLSDVETVPHSSR